MFTCKHAALAVSAALVLAGCGEAPKEPERPSDPTDYFYRSKAVEGSRYPPIRWHEREPGRLFETTLRPTALQGAFPTAYLTRITRNDQAYAKRIYDVASGGFYLSDLSPLPPEKGTRWRSDLERNEVVFEIGGWSRSGALEPQKLAELYKGRIEARGGHTVIVTEGHHWHFFTAPAASNLDGQAVAVECWKHLCAAELTIPQELAGLPSMREGAQPGRTIGAQLAIVFHPDRIDDWPEIRRKAVCFATFSIPKLDTAKIAPIGGLRCNDVRAAIGRTIVKS